MINNIWFSIDLAVERYTHGGRGPSDTDDPNLILIDLGYLLYLQTGCLYSVW